jgi:acetylornithine deacetylase
MWLQAPESYTVVFGPGDLEQNGAHTDAEHIDFHELATYAQGVSALVQELGQMTVGV